ncbi:hypothetical protein ACI2OX_02040 [Bacillus sp. N9]
MEAKQMENKKFIFSMIMLVIVGMAVIFGAAFTKERLWQMLMEKNYKK